MSVGRRLRELRDASELTLEGLHDASGVSVPYLSKLERDKSLPRRDTLIAVLDVLDPEADDVLVERDRTELAQLGYEPDAARLIAILRRLEPEARALLVERWVGDAEEAVSPSNERADARPALRVAAGRTNAG